MLLRNGKMTCVNVEVPILIEEEELIFSSLKTVISLLPSRESKRFHCIEMMNLMDRLNSDIIVPNVPCVIYMMQLADILLNYLNKNSREDFYFINRIHTRAEQIHADIAICENYPIYDKEIKDLKILLEVVLERTSQMRN